MTDVVPFEAPAEVDLYVTELPQESWDRINGYLADSLSENTRRTYLSLLTGWKLWCEDHQRRPFPASTQDVIDYLTWLADKGLRPSTIKMAKSAISTMHDKANELAAEGHGEMVVNPTRAKIVASALRGIDRRHQGGKVRRARAATGEEILTMAERSERLVDKRDAAVLLVGFGALMRRSEIVALDVEDIERRRDGSVRLHIRRSKTDQLGQGKVADLPMEAGEAVMHWLVASGITTGAVFRKMERGKQGEESKVGPRRLSAAAVREIIRSRAAASGLDDSIGPKWSGHSLRRGGATEMDANGATEFDIMLAGRWASSANAGKYVDPHKHHIDLSKALGLRKEEV